MASEPEEEAWLGLGRESPLLVSVKPCTHRERHKQAVKRPFLQIISQETRAVPSLEGLGAEPDQGSSIAGVSQEFTATFHALGEVLNVSQPPLRFLICEVGMPILSQSYRGN